MTPSQRASIAGKASAAKRTPEERMTKSRQATAVRWPNPTKATIDGVTLSVFEWCRRKGLIYETIKTRINRGMSPEEAIARPVRTLPVRHNTIKHRVIRAHGLELTPEQWAARQGVPRRRILARLARGMALNDAVASGRARHSDAMMIDGKTLREVCAENGVNLYTAKARIYNGWDPRSAATTPANRNARKLEKSANPDMICVNADWAGKRDATVVSGVFRVCPTCGARVMKDEAATSYAKSSR